MSRLLLEGRDHLPKEYDTPAGMIVDEIEQQQTDSWSPSAGHGSPTKPSLQEPKPAERYDSDNSDSLSRGPTPAPTPEVQRPTRDLSDASSEEASNPRSPRDDRFDDFGGEEKTIDATTTAISGARQASSNDGTGEQQPSPAAAASTSAAAAAAALADENVLGTEEEEDKEKVALGEGESLLREEEDDSERRGRGRKENDTEQAHDGARDDTKEEDTRGEIEASSLTDSSSGSHAQQQRDKLLDPNEVLKKRDGFDEDDETDDETDDGDRRRNSEGKVERLSPSPSSAITAAATAATTTTLDKPSELKSRRGEARLGENSSDKEEQREEDEEEKEDVIPEVEAENDDVAEDVKTEDFEEGRSRSSSQAERESEIEHPDDDGKELESKENNRQSRVVDAHHTAENLADTTFSSSGDVAIAAERIGVKDKKGDHGNNLPSSRFTEREGGGRGSVTPPEASLNTSPPPVPTPPTAATPAIITSPTSGKGDTTPSLSSNPAPSRLLASPSSPPLTTAEGKTSPSLAGLPLPPMGGARPRLGLLGSLPPVGGRNLPSLALTAAGGKSHNTSEEGEDVLKAVDTGDTSNSLSPPLSPGLLLGLSAAAAHSSSTEKGSDSAASDPARLDRTPPALGGRSNGITNDDINGDTDTGGDRGLGDPAQLLPIRATVGGQEKKEEEAAKKKEEEAAFRARLGLGEDEESEDDDEEEKEVEDGGGHVSEGFVDGRGNTNNTSSPPSSPRQHQGQEEENAGRTPPTDLRSKKSDSPVGGGGGGGDYFGDSDEADALDEISSVDEDISFEQESVNSGDGEGSDDYFS